jgi:hypothetical protein
MKERILKSLNANNLKTEEWENAAHVVASLGAAQIGSRKHLSIGALLLHIRAGHVNFLPRVLGLLSLSVASRARRNGWKGVGRHNAGKIAQIALDRFLQANCEACNGVGTIGELGQVIVICQTCKGTGNRKDDLHEMAKYLGMTKKLFNDLDMIERVRDVVSMLDRMEGYAASGTRMQARGDEHNI